MGLPAEEVHRRVETVMEQVGITYLKDRPTHALSFDRKSGWHLPALWSCSRKLLFWTSPR